MCGLAGIFRRSPDASLVAELESCLDRVAHRGPDGRGTVVGTRREALLDRGREGASWGLGHHRLAIIGRGAACAQPMGSADQGVWLTFNGEVYNHRDVRRELEDRGVVFRSSCDAEVVVAGWRAWGPPMLERFVGMFAFVLVDLREGCAFAARDRFGIKPLYLWSDGDRAALVSEPKQLLALGNFRPRADPQQLVDFLSEGALGHERAACCFSGVAPLPPGTHLSWPLDDVPSVQRAVAYWRPRATARRLAWDEAVGTTRSLLLDSVRAHLVADVPVGSCLSGGVDSSSIVGLAAHGLGTRLKVFTCCSDDPACDERPYAEAVIRHCSAAATMVNPSPADVEAELDAMVYHQDEPFSTLSVFAQWCLMRAARAANVPVLLDGQGGDECFCGYRKYAFLHLRELLGAGALWGALRHGWGLLASGDRRLAALHGAFAQRYLPGWLRSERASAASWLRPRLRQLVRAPWRERMADVQGLRGHQVADLTTWSLPALLRYLDRNSMAHGVEARVPFLDHRLVEHCLSLPDEFSFRGGRTKRLLLEAVGEALPEAVLRRTTKLGFDTPQRAWLAGPLGRWLEERVVRSERLAEFLDVGAAGAAFQRHRSGRGDVDDVVLVRVASVALWLDRFGVDVGGA